MSIACDSFGLSEEEGGVGLLVLLAQQARVLHHVGHFTADVLELGVDSDVNH
jgi:hypothetical protein